MKQQMTLRLSGILLIGALLLPLCGVVLADAPDKKAALGLEPGAVHPDIVVLTNGIYELSITDDTEWEPGVHP